jgi:hypothetical protein
VATTANHPTTSASKSFTNRLYQTMNVSLAGLSRDQDERCAVTRFSARRLGARARPLLRVPVRLTNGSSLTHAPRRRVMKIARGAYERLRDPSNALGFRSRKP